MKQSNIKTLTDFGGIILVLLGVVRYFIIYSDWFRGGISILIGGLFLAVGYLYNRVQSQSYTIIAMEDYLADKNETRRK